MNRRNFLVCTLGSAALTLGAAGPFLAPAQAADPIFPDDRILGPDDAPITIIEYSSLTCPHCAAFHKDTLPQIRDNWIADGKVRLVYRHFPLDGLALRAAAVSNCIEGERHFGFLELLFKSQQRWARADDPIKALGQLASLAGMSKSRFDSCIADEAEMDRILERAQDGRKTYDVQSTPTLIVNGRKVEGARSIEHFEEIFQEIVSES